MAAGKYSREDCILLLIQKRNELADQGLKRFPQRSDFSDYEVMSIKAFLGPWPRALEAAGLKEPRADDRLEKNREKRKRARKRRRAAKKSERESLKAEVSIYEDE